MKDHGGPGAGARRHGWKRRLEWVGARVGCFACGRRGRGIVGCPWWGNWGVLGSETPATGTADRRQRAQARCAMVSCPKSKMALLLRRMWMSSSQDHDDPDSDSDQEDLLIMKTGRRSRGAVLYSVRLRAAAPPDWVHRPRRSRLGTLSKSPKEL